MHHIVNLRAHSASYVADRIQDKKKVPKITIKKNQNYIDDLVEIWGICNAISNR